LKRLEDRFLPQAPRGTAKPRSPEEALRVPRVARRPQKTTVNTIDQGEEATYQTETRSSFIDPALIPRVSKKREPVITHKNFNRALEARPLNRPARGFGSSLPVETQRVAEPSSWSSTMASDFVPEAVGLPAQQRTRDLTVFPKEEGAPAGSGYKIKEGERSVFPFVTLEATRKTKDSFNRSSGFTKPCDGIWMDAESIIA
jgi:hypothetical protein